MIAFLGIIRETTWSRRILTVTSRLRRPFCSLCPNTSAGMNCRIHSATSIRRLADRSRHASDIKSMLGDRELTDPLARSSHLGGGISVRTVWRRVRAIRRLLVDLCQSRKDTPIDKILSNLLVRWLRKNGFWIFALVLLLLVAFLVNRARLP
jgi:hypothetical protein